MNRTTLLRQSVLPSCLLLEVQRWALESGFLRKRLCSNSLNIGYSLTVLVTKSGPFAS